MSQVNLERLIYLAAESGVLIPKSFVRYLPQGELLAEITKSGLLGAGALLDVDDGQLVSLYKEGLIAGGAITDRGREFRILIAKAIYAAVQDSSDIAGTIMLMSRVQDFLEGRSSLVAVQEVSLSEVDPKALSGIYKWDSGFMPMDQLVGGFYQGIFTILAPPGTGKTSLLLSLMSTMRQTNAASSIWFFEPEIPMGLLQHRMKPLLSTTTFLQDDRLVSGHFTPTQILEKVRENPDPDRVIMIDSLHVLSGNGEARRFEIEGHYKDLVELKNYCRAIILTTQPRRGAHTINLESGAESAAIERYSDGIIGARRISKGVSNIDGGATLLLNIPKNRFGIPEIELTFRYDYENLTALADTTQMITADDLEWDTKLDPNSGGLEVKGF